jgi:peptidoglycan/xylan/chitin deacetylase (PgdA/CDA1 family)
LLGTLACGKVGPTFDLLHEGHPEVLYSVETDEPVLALTIDDGPDPLSTPRILAVLAENGARATFFLVSDRVAGNEALVEAILAGGHELGNHLTREEPSIDLPPEEFEREFDRAHEVLTAFSEPRWFRPGSGWHDDEMIETVRERGYRVALGYPFALDAHVPCSWFATRVLLWSMERGDVIILHDVGSRGERTANTLATLLPELRRRGYRIVSLSELADLAPPRAGEEKLPR